MTNSYDPRLDPEALLSPSEVSKMIGLGLKKLEKDRRENTGIPFIRLCYNRVRYRRQDILDWLNAHRIEPGPGVDKRHIRARPEPATVRG